MNKADRFTALFCVFLTLSISFAAAKEFSLLYDANGNLVQDDKYDYEYDSFNQLIKVREDNSNGRIIAEYFYDDTGNRIKKIEYPISGEQIKTYYINRNFVRVVDSSGTHDTIYYYDDTDLIGKKDPNGKKYYYHPDHLGSTSIVTDQYQNIVEETEYSPFGEITKGGTDRYTFTGQENDAETELMYYGARYYSPFLKHFTQPDTVIQDVYEPQNLNRYSYVRNNPMKYEDKTGKSPTLVTGLIGAVSGGLIGAAFSFGVQMWQSGGDISQVNAGNVGKAAAIGAISGGVAGLTLGVGNTLIGAAGLTGKAALAAEGTAVVTSSVASGQVSRAGWNVAEGKEWNENLMQAEDIALDAGIGLTTLGLGKGYQRYYVKKSWASESHLSNHLSDPRTNPKGYNELKFTTSAKKMMNNLGKSGYKSNYRYVGDAYPDYKQLTRTGRIDPGFFVKNQKTAELVYFNNQNKIYSYHSGG